MKEASSSGGKQQTTHSFDVKGIEELSDSEAVLGKRLRDEQGEKHRGVTVDLHRRRVHADLAP